MTHNKIIYTKMIKQKKKWKASENINKYYNSIQIL